MGIGVGTIVGGFIYRAAGPVKLFMLNFVITGTHKIYKIPFALYSIFSREIITLT